MQHVDSFEKAAEWATRLYTSKLPLYFDDEYVRLIWCMAGALLGVREITVVQTYVPLSEPLVSEPLVPDRDSTTTLIISLPLVSVYMNQPVERVTRAIKYARSNLNVLEDARSVITRRSRNKDFTLFGPSVAEEASADDIEALRRIEQQRREAEKDPRVAPFLRFTDEDNARFQLVMRVVLLVAHWHQHVRRRIPFDSHEGFRPMERAVAIISNDD